MQQLINKSGFTLIEITLALLILAVGLVGILTLFPVGFDASVRAANITKATFLAQEKIEDAKVAGYDGVVNVSKTQFAAPYDNFEYEVAVSDVIAGSLYKVAVTVYWPFGETNQRNVELNTYIAKYEP